MAVKKVDLLLEQVDNKYVQENFRRLKQFLDDSDLTGGTGDTFNITNTTVEGDDIWEKKTDSINASSTKTIDVVALSDFKLVKYIVTFYNVAQGVTRGFEITVTNANSTLTDVVRAMQGSSINYDIEAIVSGSDMNLQVVNDESFILNATLARLVL